MEGCINQENSKLTMHSSAKFEIHETEDNGNWDLWNDQSPQGTIFTSSLYFRLRRYITVVFL